MIHKIFAIHDTQARAYLPPFFLHQTEMAIRTFRDCINSDDHQFGRNPGDYTLFEIGNYDDELGQITNHKEPIMLGNGLKYTNGSMPTTELTSEERTP